jgi:hypothetical protein
MLYQASYGKPEPMPSDFRGPRSAYLRMTTVMASLAGMALLLEPLGFRLSFLIFYGVILTVLGLRRLVLTALIATAASFGVYHVFVNLFRIPLPTGFLGI